MKLYKSLALAGALLIAGAATAQAQGYNRIGISYDNTSYGYNKQAGGKDSNFSTNGFGLNYIHGFELTKSTPIFLEVGVNVDFNFNSDTEDSGKDYLDDEYWVRAAGTSKFQFINFQVPVNFGYRFKATPDFSIAPYIGLNFKLNVVGKYREDYEIETNLPNSILGQMGYTPGDLTEEGDWLNLYSKDDMESRDLVWNRFQMGWHIGVGFQYKPFYLGVQYGTDFIPAFKYEKAKINTGNFKLTLGYNF